MPVKSTTENQKLIDVLSFNPCRLSGIIYWALTAINKVPKTAIIVGDKNSIVSRLCDSAGFNVLSILPENLVKSNNFWLWENAQTIGYEPIILGTRSIDSVLSSRVEAGFDSLGKDPIKVKKRSINDHFSGLEKLDWIHTIHSDANNVIHGATDLITRDSPVITISGINTTCDVSGYIELLDSYGYQCLNIDLSRIQNEKPLRELAFSSILALPKNDSRLIKLKQLLEFDELFDYKLGTRACSDAVKRYYSKLVSYKTKASKRLKQLLFGKRLKLSLNNSLSKGFYTENTDGVTRWNWSGPDNDSKINCCLPSPGQYHFRLNIYCLPELVENTTLFVFINGQLKLEQVIEGSDVVAFDHSFTKDNFVENNEILISSSKMLQVEDKIIGYAIEEIEIYFEDGELS